MQPRRVVITGMGVISSLGQSIDQYWNSLVEGKSGVKRITKFDVDNIPSQIAAEITDFDPLNYMDKREARRMATFTQYAAAAAKIALESSGFKNQESLDQLDKFRVGVNVGTGIGGIEVFQNNVMSYLDGGWKKVSPLFIPTVINNMASGMVAMQYGFMGPNYCTVSACATANHTIQDAYHIIKRNEADMMVAGGVEAALIPLSLAGFSASRALSTKRNHEPEKASRPFDKDRDGFVMSEGGGLFVIEELEHAQKRNAEILCEIIGTGMTCDAYHITEPHPEGLGAMKSMQLAIASAHLSTKDIQYVNAHGTSTPVGDIAEINAIKKVFTEHANKVYINSTKSLIGHGLGAAGSFEAIVCIQSLRTGIMHPTINLDDPMDEVQGMNIIGKSAVKADLNVVLSNSFGFGGHNCSIVFKKYEH